MIFSSLAAIQYRALGLAESYRFGIFQDSSPTLYCKEEPTFAQYIGEVVSSELMFRNKNIGKVVLGD